MTTIAGIELQEIDLAPILDKAWQETIIAQTTEELGKHFRGDRALTEATRSMWLCVKWAHLIAKKDYDEPEPPSVVSTAHRQQVNTGSKTISTNSWFVAYAEGRGVYMVDPVNFSTYAGIDEQLSKMATRITLIHLTDHLGWSTSDACDDDESVPITTPQSDLLMGTDYLYEMADAIKMSRGFSSWLLNRAQTGACKVTELFTVHYYKDCRRHWIAKMKEFNYLTDGEKGMMSYFPMDKTSTNLWESKHRQEVKIGRFIRMFFDKAWLDHFNIEDKDIEAFVNSYVAEFNFMDEFREVQGEDIRYWYHENNYDKTKRVLNNSCMRYAKVQTRMGFYVDNPETIHMLITVNAEEKLTGRALVWIDEQGKKWLDRIYADDKTAEAFRKYREKQGWGDARGYEAMHVKPKHPWYVEYPYVDTVNRMALDGRLYNGNGAPADTINIYSYQGPKKLEPLNCKKCGVLGFQMRWHSQSGTDTNGYCPTCWVTERNKAYQEMIDKGVKDGYLTIRDMATLVDRRMMTSTRLHNMIVYATKDGKTKFIHSVENDRYEFLTPEREERDRVLNERRMELYNLIHRGTELDARTTWEEIEDARNMGYLERRQTGSYMYRERDRDYWHVYTRTEDGFTHEVMRRNPNTGEWVTREAYEADRAERAERLKAKLDQPHEKWVYTLRPDAGPITFSWNEGGTGTSYAKRVVVE